MGAIFFKIIEVLNSCEYNLVQVVYHKVHFLLLLQFNKASPGWWMAFLYSELTFRDSGSFSFFDFTIPQSLTVIYIKSGERYKECEETTCLLFKGLIWEVTHSTYACIYWWECHVVYIYFPNTQFPNIYIFLNHLHFYIFIWLCWVTHSVHVGVVVIVANFFLMIMLVLLMFPINMKKALVPQ